MYGIHPNLTHAATYTNELEKVKKIKIIADMARMYQDRLPEPGPRKRQDYNLLETQPFHLTAEERKCTVGKKKTATKVLSIYTSISAALSIQTMMAMISKAVTI